MPIYTAGSQAEGATEKGKPNLREGLDRMFCC